ncbi:MBOAT family protein, partial [Ruminococcaceae bacterium OttesenSCG-928-N02]|nr:MBOAT family protein [Ruminococcaceae bacterium OttesenSCG-928-N02]
MLFTSAPFLLFFPVVCLGWYALPAKVKPFWLLLANYYFYFCWHPGYTLLLLCTTVINFAGGHLFAPERKLNHRKGLFAFQVLLSLSGLFFFKYLTFFSGIVTAVFGRFGVLIPTMELSLGVVGGISFYTLQALGYTIDVYLGKTERETNFISFALFVSFFPLLLSGPIARAGNLLPQLKKRPSYHAKEVEMGFIQMLWGYFKKMVIADGLAVFVNLAYAQNARLPAASIILATVFYSFQIYCDFSGYSDIAIGAARMMGICMPANFAGPYFATTIRDFWNRWHISLSGWLQDYIFTPIVWGAKPRHIGGRAAKPPIVPALLLTFLASGLWHGASFNYVLWGLYNGILVVLSTLLAKPRKKMLKKVGKTFAAPLVSFLQTLGTFVLVSLGYVFFRSENLEQAFSVFLLIPQGVGALFSGTAMWETALSALTFFTENGPIILLCTVAMLLFEYFEVKGKKP